jgi:hypothetical protein
MCKVMGENTEQGCMEVWERRRGWQSRQGDRTSMKMFKEMLRKNKFEQ